MASVLIRAVYRIIFVGWLFTTGSAWADVYEYVDEFGITHYSDSPDDPRYFLVISEPTDLKKELATAPETPAIVVTTKTKVVETIEKTAQRYQLDQELLHAVISVESAYQERAQSPKGALGLMQLMPATAARYGVTDPFDHAQNVEAGAKYLRDLLKLFNNDVSLALAGYNAGEQAVIKYGNRIPPYRETIRYVPKVMAIYKGLLAKRTS
jgi:soluble lytic murein transglycosylase-like protein